MYIYIGIGQYKQKLIMYSAMKEFFFPEKEEIVIWIVQTCQVMCTKTGHEENRSPFYREEEEVKARGCYSH